MCELAFPPFLRVEAGVYHPGRLNAKTDWPAGMYRVRPRGYKHGRGFLHFMMDTTATRPPMPDAGDDRAAVWRDARIVTVVGFGYFLNAFYLLSLPPFFPILKAEFDISYAALGAVMTGFSLATSVCQIPFGFLVDRIGARRVLMGGICLLSGSVALVGMTSSYSGLLLLFILAGIGNGVFQPADFTILSSRIAPHRLGRAFSFHSSFGYIGFVLAPTTMGVLGASFGWRTALVIVGLAGFAAVLALSYWRRDFGEDSVAAIKAAAIPGEGGLRGLLVLLTPTMVFFLVLYIFTLSAGSGIRNFIVTAITMISDIPLSFANAALTGFYVASTLGTLAGGVVSDHTSRHDLSVAAALLLGTIAFAAIGALPMPTLLIAAVLGMAGFMHGFIRPPRDLMIRAATPAGALGKVFASVSTVGQVAAAIMPTFLGWLIDIGEPRWVIWSIAVLLGITAVLMVAGRKIALPPR